MIWNIKEIEGKKKKVGQYQILYGIQENWDKILLFRIFPSTDRSSFSQTWTGLKVGPWKVKKLRWYEVEDFE